MKWPFGNGATVRRVEGEMYRSRNPHTHTQQPHREREREREREKAGGFEEMNILPKNCRNTTTTIFLVVAQEKAHAAAHKFFQKRFLEGVGEKRGERNKKKETTVITNQRHHQKNQLKNGLRNRTFRIRIDKCTIRHCMENMFCPNEVGVLGES